MYFHRVERIGEKVPPVYQSASFDNFIFDEDISNFDPRCVASKNATHIEVALLMLKAYIREFPTAKDRPGLLIVGPTGTGKTHLAAAVFNELTRNGTRGLFYDYQDLAERIRNGARDGSAVMELDACRTVDLLFLDGILSPRRKDGMEDAILRVLKHRCNARKPLIATTNLSDDRITPRSSKDAYKVASQVQLAEAIGPAARSRLFEMCRVITLPGLRDFRLEKADIF